jgi:uroporphyrinogen-III decarboxylase
MNWTLLVPLLVTSMLTILGWYVVQRAGRIRDAENRRIERRVGFLLEAYRRLETASNRALTDQTRGGVESAIADVQLLGTPRQVALAVKFAEDCAGPTPASALDLLRQLRDDLRRELTLEPLDGGPLQLRFNRHEPNGQANKALNPTVGR